MTHTPVKAGAALICGFGFTVDGRFLIMQHLFKKYLVYQYVRFVAGEIFIHYTDERFPFLLGRKGSFDAKGAYLSVI